MVRARNINILVLSTLNIILLVAGVTFFFGGAVYLKFHGSTSTICLNNVAIAPFLVVAAVFAILVSVVGLMVIWCCRRRDEAVGSSSCIGFYIFLLVYVIISLILAAVIVITPEIFKSPADKSNSKDFADFKNCLVNDGQFCNSLSSYSDFDLNHQISPLQGGCCMPPRECGFEYRNATFWTVLRAVQDKMRNSDCRKWSNKQNELCFNCETCKVQILASYTKQYTNLAIFYSVLISFILILFFVFIYAPTNRETSQIHPEQQTIPII